ncbi:hypothetical protein [Azotobacter salinestris]|uniref:hypothetical protein n=1 Tax=Azotobacter salinestris TaxID=69964 RepID=UPI0032DE3851
MTVAPLTPHSRHSNWRQRLLRLMPWHRRLALLACCSVFVWALTGVLHPLMTNLQPRPAVLQPPPANLLLQELQAPASVLAAAGIDKVQALRLLALDGEPYYQARLPGRAEPRYWHARSGVAADLDARHAERLARHYLGSTEPLNYRGSLDAFNGEYAFVNRLLPVARVDTQRDDGLRLYVDLYHDRLGTLVDERKAWFSTLFQALHSFHWLNTTGPLRLIVMGLLLTVLLATALLGISLFVARRKAHSRLRRVHGWLGVGVALTTCSFAVSGGWHLWHKATALPAPTSFSPDYSVVQLSATPDSRWLGAGEQAHGLSLVSLDGELVWRLEYLSVDGSRGAHWRSGTGQPLATGTDDRYLGQHFGHYANALGLGPLQEITRQDRFDHEYGFLFKRLPVFKARYADEQHTALYIDPLDGALAARVNDRDRAEGWIFAYLHKWEALGHLGKPTKDVLVTGLALAHLLVAGLGLWLWRGRRNPRQAKSVEASLRG